MQDVRKEDGIDFDMNGPLRIETRSDGLYVVGHGLLCPIKTEAEGRDLITRLLRGKSF